MDRYLYQIAKQSVDCPRCGVTRTHLCVRRGGRLASLPHVERIAAYRKLIGETEWKKVHPNVK